MNKYALFFNSCIKIDNEIWFSAANYNGLYRYNMKEKYTERVSDFINEDLTKDDLYHKVCLYKNFLIFVPCNANYISVFDINKRQFQQISIRDYKTCCDSSLPCFLEGIVYRDALYVIGYGYPGIVKVDLITYEAKIIYIIDDKPDCYEGQYFGVQAAVNANLMYIPCCYKNEILLFDMNEDKATWIKIGENQNQYLRVLKDGDYLYLLEKNRKNIIQWNCISDVCIEMETKFQKDYVDALICVSEDYVWAISMVSGEIYRFNKSNSEIYDYILLNKEMSIEYAVAYLDGLYLAESYTGDWFYLNNDCGISNLQIRMEDPRNKEDIWRIFWDAKKSGETAILPIEYLIFGVLNEEKLTSREMDNECSIGSGIWRKLNI